LLFVRFGGRFHKEKPFENKRVYLTEMFKFENKDRFNMREFYLLVQQVGKGKLVSEPEGADYHLIALDEKANTDIDNDDVIKMTWKEFFMFVQPDVFG